MGPCLSAAERKLWDYISLPSEMNGILILDSFALHDCLYYWGITVFLCAWFLHCLLFYIPYLHGYLWLHFLGNIRVSFYPHVFGYIKNSHRFCISNHISGHMFSEKTHSSLCRWGIGSGNRDGNRHSETDSFIAKSTVAHVGQGNSGLD